MRLRQRPPRPDQPLVDRVDRKLAHSLRFVFPRMTAPASCSLAMMNASAGATEPSSASDPAVVDIRPVTATLSFTRMGMPCSAPRTLPALRSASSAAASAPASGLASITDRSEGPCRSIAAMRARYFSASDCEVSCPRPSLCRSSMVSSFSSKSADWGLSPDRSASGTVPGRGMTGDSPQLGL
jgi:hypothetical protein